MIKLKSLLKEQEQLVNLGPLKIQVRQIDMHYYLYQQPNGNIIVYPHDQSRFFEMINKFGENDVISPITNLINNKYGECGFFKLMPNGLEASKPLTYIFIKNS